MKHSKDRRIENAFNTFMRWSKMEVEQVQLEVAKIIESSNYYYEAPQWDALMPIICELSENRTEAMGYWQRKDFAYKAEEDVMLKIMGVKRAFL